MAEEGVEKAVAKATKAAEKTTLPSHVLAMISFDIRNTHVINLTLAWAWQNVSARLTVVVLKV